MNNYIQEVMEKFEKMTESSFLSNIKSLKEQDAYLEQRTNEHLYYDQVYPDSELELDPEKIKSFIKQALQDQEEKRIMECVRGYLKEKHNKYSTFHSSSIDTKEKGFFTPKNLSATEKGIQNYEHEQVGQLWEQESLVIIQNYKQRIIDWCKKRCEDNITAHGTDKWNGDLEDLIGELSK